METVLHALTTQATESKTSQIPTPTSNQEQKLSSSVSTSSATPSSDLILLKMEIKKLKKKNKRLKAQLGKSAPSLTSNNNSPEVSQPPTSSLSVEDEIKRYNEQLVKWNLKFSQIQPGEYNEYKKKDSRFSKLALLVNRVKSCEERLSDSDKASWDAYEDLGRRLLETHLTCSSRERRKTDTVDYNDEREI